MELIRRDGIWRLFDRHVALIITDEKQLEIILEDPAKPLQYDDNKGFSGEEKSIYEGRTSLLDICKEGAKLGAKRLEVSYDFFFGGNERRNYPDSKLTLKAFKVIHDVARQYGLGFSASIISPLDLGGGYVKTHKETGLSCQYMEGSIDPVTGRYSVDMVLQKQWTNNKGPIRLELQKVLLHAFREERIGDTCFYCVDPDDIMDISYTASFAEEEGSASVTGAGYGSARMRVYGLCPREDAYADLNRCLAIAVYRTPELDYFSPEALPYIKSVIDIHREAGISYQGFYSDEMHIQFDWDLEAHFGHSEINTRYITDHLSREYAEKYGERYRDLVKYLIYFSYHQHDFLGGEEGGLPAQHVFGRDEKDVYDTWLFRKRYFEMLQDKVVELSAEAKKYAETFFGSPIMTRAHATWQESPTCDHFSETARFSEMCSEEYSRYDYTTEYVWSSSIRENTSACYDYFKWNDFLSGGGTDHPEGGFTDRNYYAEALAASLGELNRFPYAYCADWGSPREVSRRIDNVRVTYGNMNFGAVFADNLVQGMSARETDILALYPLDLNHVEERFGSWMVQYGYCNYITEGKLLEHASVCKDGHLTVRGRKYSTLLVLFQPFIKAETLQLLKSFIHRGGKVIWTSIHPVWCGGYKAVEQWKELFGVLELQPAFSGLNLERQSVNFKNMLAGVQPMEISTGLLPDLAYPVVPADEIEAVAYSESHILGTVKKYAGGGMAVYLGFRPRDDQSCSTGRDIDTLFSILLHSGCYRPGSAETASRPAESRYNVNVFKNGAVSLANHYRTFYERWKGKFFRDEKEDQEFLKDRRLPEIEIELENEMVQGHMITYKGTDVLTFNADRDMCLKGFAGSSCTGITVDGRSYCFTDVPARIVWTEIAESFLTEGLKKLYLVCVDRPCKARIPLPAAGSGDLYACICREEWFEADREFDTVWEDGNLILDITPDMAGRWIAVYEPVRTVLF